MTFFFNDTATTEIYTLSLHDALPISCRTRTSLPPSTIFTPSRKNRTRKSPPSNKDRKSTRLNSSHQIISYVRFFLKKKDETRHLNVEGVSIITPDRRNEFNQTRTSW